MAVAPTPQQQQQPQQVQQVAGAGQADYSKQWAEYYRTIGKIDEAEAIENQLKGVKVIQILSFFSFMHCNTRDHTAQMSARYNVILFQIFTRFLTSVCRVMANLPPTAVKIQM